MAGMELVFFIAAQIALCVRLVTKTTLVRHQLPRSSACTASKSLLFLTASESAEGGQEARGGHSWHS